MWFNVSIWTTVMIYLLLILLLGWATGVLMPMQMLRKYPRAYQVIPMVVDCYYLACLSIIAPLLAYIDPIIVGKWSPRAEFIALGLGLVGAILFLVFVVRPGKYHSSLGGNRTITPVGYAMLPFVMWMLAEIGLFIFTSATGMQIIVVAFALAVTAPMAMLVPMHFIKDWFLIGWIPNVFGEEPRLFWMIGGAESAVVVLAGAKYYFGS